MRITLDTTSGQVPCGFLLEAESGETVAIQTDWDFPGVAACFGWEPCCGSGETDGTVPCPACGKDVSTMMDAARDFLDAHDGDSIEDPGYF